MPIDQSTEPRYSVTDLLGNIIDPYTDDYGAAVGTARSYAWRERTPTQVVRLAHGSTKRVPVWRSWVEGRGRRADGSRVGYPS